MPIIFGVKGRGITKSYARDQIYRRMTFQLSNQINKCKGKSLINPPVSLGENLSAKNKKSFLMINKEKQKSIQHEKCVPIAHLEETKNTCNKKNNT